MTGTQAGVIMGTAAYMSPEQARGKTIDKRTDIWAFGCVLYEMLTGHPAFEGETVSEILAEILKGEPDWSRLPPGTSPVIRRLLRRCLQKERTARLHDIADARLDIEEAQSGPPRDTQAQASRSSGRERLAWASMVAILVLGVALLGARAMRPAPPVSEVRLDVATPPTTDATAVAISPNGQELAFVATSEGRPHLWVRSLRSSSARPLPGTEEPSEPFWSPDGLSLGFFANGQLKRIDIDTGAIRPVADARGGIGGGAWNRDGLILFVPTATSPVFRVPATGGEPVAVTRLDPPQQTGHSLPRFLPDGRHFLYRAFGSLQATGIYIGDVDGAAGQRLLDDDVQTVYASGHLLFVRQRTLLAQAFDPVRLALSGNPFPVAEGVLGRTLSASDGGPIVYRASPTSGAQRQFAWFDRSGKETKVGDPDDANPVGMWMSPDGRRVLMGRATGGASDIWSLDTTREVLSRLTTDPRVDNYPVASPDGSRIVLFRSLDAKTGFDLWALPMDGDRKPFPVVQSGFDDRDGQFSPDGRWIAYQSDRSGRSEIYLQPFPGPGDPLQVSTAGGAQVRWRHDGQELFYIALDGRLMAVSTRLVAGGSIDFGAPVPLFTTHVGAVVQGNRQLYSVVEDGQRFLMNTLVEEAPAPITVILNWKPPR
jgi:Tol biopolymer transport system component